MYSFFHIIAHTNIWCRYPVAFIIEISLMYPSCIAAKYNTQQSSESRWYNTLGHVLDMQPGASFIIIV